MFSDVDVDEDDDDDDDEEDEEEPDSLVVIRRGRAAAVVVAVLGSTEVATADDVDDGIIGVVVVSGKDIATGGFADPSRDARPRAAAAAMSRPSTILPSVFRLVSLFFWVVVFAYYSFLCTTYQCAYILFFVAFLGCRLGVCVCFVMGG